MKGDFPAFTAAWIGGSAAVRSLIARQEGGWDGKRGGGGERGLVAVMPKYSLPASLDMWGEMGRQLQSTQRLMPFPHELLKVPQRRVGGSQAASY